MNFTQVRGYNAYAQFSARIRDAVKNRESEAGSNAGKSSAVSDTKAEPDYSRSVYSEPVDTVTISEPARKASTALMMVTKALPEHKQMSAVQYGAVVNADKDIPVLRENSPHIEFRQWLKTSGTMGSAGIISGGFTHKIPGSVMNDALLGSSMTVGDDEEFSINIDILSTVTVTSKNAEKARAIQNLLNSTPSGINWGLLLATLPPR